MTRRRALWLLGPASLVLFAVLAVVDRRMQDAGGHGIVAFELAGSPRRAAEILAAWGKEGRDAAHWSLWLDYPYLVAYGAFLWLAVRAVRDAALRRGWAGFAHPGEAIALLAVAGAACDAAEDAGLLLVLGGHGGSAAPRVATAFAVAKFACLAVVVVYLIGGLARLAAARDRGARLA